MTRPGLLSALAARPDAAAPLAGFLLSVALLFPGFLSPDSTSQLVQARTLDFGDWHPPVMTAIWALADRLVSGPFPMLVLQLGLVWTGTFLILRSPAASSRRRGLLALAFVFFPPVFGILGAIWKDVHLAGWLLLAFGLCRELLRRERAGERCGAALPAAAVGCLLLAAAMRHNGAGAIVAPLALVAWAGPFRSRPPVRRALLAVAAAVVAALLVTAAAFAANRVLTRRQQHVWTALALHDLLGVAALAGDDELVGRFRRPPLDDLFRRPPTLAAVTASYRPELWSSSIDDGLTKDLFRRVADPPELAALAAAWRTAVGRHPGDWLEHRRRVFRAVLLGDEQAVYFSPLPRRWAVHQEGHDLAHRYRLSPLQWRLRTALQGIVRATPIALPALWLGALPLVALWALSRFRDDPLPIFLLASGLGYQATYALLAVADDYRYSHWMIASVWLSVLLLLLDGRVRHSVAASAPERPAATSA